MYDTELSYDIAIEDRIQTEKKMHASPFSRRMTVGGTRICPAAGGWRRKSIRRCQPLRFLRFSGQRFAEAAGPDGVVARFDVAARIGAYGDYTAAVLPAQVAAEGFVMGLRASATHVSVSPQVARRRARFGVRRASFNA